MRAWPGILILIASSVIAFAPPRSRNSVILSFTTRSPITLHEPVVVDCRLENQISEPVVADFGFSKQGEMGTLRFAVTEPGGNEMVVPPSDASSVIHSPVKIERGKSFHRQYILDEWHKFAQPGMYRLKLWLSTKIVTQKGDPVETQRDTLLNVHILPRDATKLVHRCRDLLEQVRAIRQKGEKFPTEIAQIMSYMNDPVCIPCVQSLYQEAQDIEATDGLLRIGTDEAMEAMIVGLESNDKDAARYARGILRDHLQNVRSPLIRAKIITAIK